MASLRSRLILIAMGISLGLLARFTLGSPNGNGGQPVFEPLPNQPADAQPSQPVRPSAQEDHQGLVPPIQLPLLNATVPADEFFWADDVFAHDYRAAFHPHGTQVCATGCAVSNHPTSELTAQHFSWLLQQFAAEPLDETSTALEELLYFGRQTRSLLAQYGYGALDRRRADLLREQLKLSHALISIRVIDEQGEVRSWIPPTRVPLDRRHIFEMETNRLQPLVTSGTVKRVGLHHLWTRLWLEGVHFVAGPWFAVHRSGNDWQQLGDVWISDGTMDWRGQIEIKVSLERVGDVL